MPMRMILTVVSAVLLVSCGATSRSIDPPRDSEGIEIPSDSSGRTARLAGRWISDPGAIPTGAIRLEIARDGTYSMRLLESRDALVDTIVSASAGSLIWTKAGFLQGTDEHPAPEMRRYGRWTAGFGDDARKIVMATESGDPVVFQRDAAAL